MHDKVSKYRSIHWQIQIYRWWNVLVLKIFSIFLREADSIVSKEIEFSNLKKFLNGAKILHHEKNGLSQ